MENNNIESAIKDIFTSLIDGTEAETRDNYNKIAQKLIYSGYDLKNMNIFNIMVRWEVEKVLEFVVSSLHETLHDGLELNKIKFLYLNYTFMSCNIEKLIVHNDGSVCCADKSRHILDTYKNYLITGKIPEMDEKHYWVPNFGTYLLWFDLCDGLYRLYYGNPSEYMNAYKALLESKMRV